MAEELSGTAILLGSEDPYFNSSDDFVSTEFPVLISALLKVLRVVFAS